MTVEVSEERFDLAINPTKLAVVGPSGMKNCGDVVGGPKNIENKRSKHMSSVCQFGLMGSDEDKKVISSSGPVEVNPQLNGAVIVDSESIGPEDNHIREGLGLLIKDMQSGPSEVGINTTISEDCYIIKIGEKDKENLGNSTGLDTCNPKYLSQLALQNL